MNHHGAGLRTLTGDPELPRALVTRREWPELDPADQAMLSYSVKLTRRPWAIEAADVDELRSHGFDDRGVLDICQVVSYYNYVNRLADGVGVELEPGWAERELTASREELEQLREAREGSE